jgi:hypothetical protein
MVTPPRSSLSTSTFCILEGFMVSNLLVLQGEICDSICDSMSEERLVRGPMRQKS